MTRAERTTRIAELVSLLMGEDAAPAPKPRVKVASRLEAIEASRTERCKGCKRMFSVNGLKAHNENRKHVSKPCSQWKHAAR